MKPIPKKQVEGIKTEDEAVIDLTPEGFMQGLTLLTAGEGDSRHLANTANSGKMADLIRWYDNLMPCNLEPLRIVIVKVLIKTMNEVILKKFVENHGLAILNLWLEMILEQIKI